MVKEWYLMYFTPDGELTYMSGVLTDAKPAIAKIKPHFTQNRQEIFLVAYGKSAEEAKENGLKRMKEFLEEQNGNI